MKTVTQYEVPPGKGGIYIIQVPRGARPVSSGVIDYKVYVWAEVDTDKTEMEDLKLLMVGGAEEITRKDYVSTFLSTIFLNGNKPLHVYVLAHYSSEK